MIDSNLNEKFYDVLGELMKSLVRGKTSKRASQMQSHLTFADGISSWDCGHQQRSLWNRAPSQPPLEISRDRRVVFAY